MAGEAENRFPDSDGEEEEAGASGVRWREQAREEAAEQADEADSEVVGQGDFGERSLDGVEAKSGLAECVPIERGQPEVNCGEADGVDHHQLALLESGCEHRTGGVAGDQRGEKLERINVEEQRKQERGIDNDGPDIVQAVAAEEAEVVPPDHHEEDKAKGEGKESEEDDVQLGVGVGDFERDDEEGEREAEDDVGEAVDARHSEAAQAEAVLGDMFVEGLHGCADSVSGWERIE